MCQKVPHFHHASNHIHFFEKKKKSILAPKNPSMAPKYSTCRPRWPLIFLASFEHCLLPKHSYNSRHENVDIPFIRLKKSENDIKYSARQFFNSLPLSLKKSFVSNSTNIFLNQLKKFCIEKAFYSIDELIVNS